MEGIAIQLDPDLLENPDADLRYVLPGLLRERSGGNIQEDGYDYAGPRDCMVVFLQVQDYEAALACILEVIAEVRVMGNDLQRAAVVARHRGGTVYEVVYPADYGGRFPADAEG